MNAKKLMSVLLAMALVACLSCTTIFAAENPSIGDPTPTQEPTVSVAPDAGRNPSIGDVHMQSDFVVLNNDLTWEGEPAYMAATPGSTMTVSAKNALDAATAKYNWNFTTFELIMVRDASGMQIPHGTLPAPVTIDLNTLFPGQFNFAQPNTEYVLLHYSYETNALEELPVNAQGQVTLTSFSPVRLVAKSIAVQPEVTPAPVVPEVTPAPFAPVAPAAPVAPQSPKTADSSIAMVLGLLAAAAGAGVMLTREHL